MPRAIWKGAISFGLVTIPVGLYSAVEGRGELHFRQLHAKDGSPIDYKRFCAEEDVEVAWKDIVKGYEHRKGEFVVLTDEDFAKARVPATQTFEIRDFVPRSDIDGRYFDHPYFLAPAGKSATKAYGLLRDALAESGRVGVGKVVLRQREHLAALQPSGAALELTTLRFADELRTPKDLDLPAAGKGWTKKEMTLARGLIDSLASEWKPEQYTDEYEAVLRDIIDRKAAGERISAPKLERARPVRNLVDALEASLKAPRRRLRSIPGGRTDNGGRRARPRRHGRKKAA
jgi:DNA end-binding protein Ku